MSLKSVVNIKGSSYDDRVRNDMSEGEASSGEDDSTLNESRTQTINNNTFEDNISSPSEDEGDLRKKLARAERFELSPTSAKRISKTQLRKSLALQSRDFAAGWKKDTLLFLSSKRFGAPALHNYIKGYSFTEVSWLKDGACCVTFSDHKVANKALTDLSCPIIYPSDYPPGPLSASEPPRPKKKFKAKKEASSSSSSSSDSSSDGSSSSSSSSSSESSSEDSSDKNEESKNSTIGKSGIHWKDLQAKEWVPSGRWRYGVPAKNISQIFMRYSHCHDHKLFGEPKKFDFVSKTKQRVIRVPRLSFGRGKPDVDRFDLPNQSRRIVSYRDLDNPHSETDPFADNWDREPDESKMDFQQLLEQHVIRKNMKRKAESSSEDSEEEERVYHLPAKRRRTMETAYASDSQSDDSNDGVVDWKTKSKVPRMRMYADAEQEKQTQIRKPPLQSRIGPRNHSNPSRKSGFDLRERLSSRR